MMRGQNLYISRLLRVAFLCSLPALAVQAFAQMAPLGRPDPDDLFPHSGARAELLTVLDMRGDRSAVDRLFAESIQGLANSDPIRTDKIYLILDDKDDSRFKFLVAEQYVLASYTEPTLDALLNLRSSVRSALLIDRNSAFIAPAVAGCERLLIVADPSMVDRFHLDVKLDLRGKFKTPTEATAWLMDNYKDRISHKALSLNLGFNLVDYEVANRIAAFPSGDLGSADLQDDLVTMFDANIPCFGTVTGDQAGQTVIDNLSRAAKFLVPTDSVSNLSLWTTFTHSTGEFSEEFYSAASRQPRATRAEGAQIEDFTTAAPTVPRFEPGIPAPMFINKKLDWTLFQLAPPLAPKHFDRSDGLQLGFVSEDEFGKAYGADRDRVWSDYQWVQDELEHTAR